MANCHAPTFPGGIAWAEASATLAAGPFPIPGGGGAPLIWWNELGQPVRPSQRFAMDGALMDRLGVARRLQRLSGPQDRDLGDGLRWISASELMAVRDLLPERDPAPPRVPRLDRALTAPRVPRENYTPELRDSLLADVHAGSTVIDAARRFGVAKSTAYEWVAKERGRGS